MTPFIESWVCSKFYRQLPVHHLIQWLIEKKWDFKIKNWKKRQHFSKFIFQPKVLELFFLSFDTHIRSFPVIWKSRILKNFEKNLEKFSKIFKNIFFNFSPENYQEWLPRIFLTALSLDFGLDRWQPSGNTRVFSFLEVFKKLLAKQIIPCIDKTDLSL